jgi:MFS family permease
MSKLPLSPSQSPADAAATGGLAGALAGLAALAIAMGIGRFAFTPVLPMMLEEGSLSIQDGAFLASANYLGYLLGALSALVWRIPADRAIRAGLLVIAVSTMAMSVPLPFVAWLLLRLVAGVASAWVLISISAWSLDWAVRHRRPFLGSLVFAGVGAGIAAAGVLCIGLIAMNESAATAWQALGILALGTALLVWRAFGRPAQSGAAMPVRSAVHWDPTAMRLVLCYGLFGFGYIIPATFLPVMAKAALEGAVLFSWSWPLFGTAAALSVLAVAPMTRRFGHRHLWILCHLVMAAGLALPLVSTHLLAILGAALSVGGTFMVITLTAMQEAKRVAGPAATTLIAAMTAAFAAGQILGPLTVGAGSFSGALGLAAFVLAISALLLAWPSRATVLEREP